MSTKHQAGKGSRPRNNWSSAFRSNWDGIDWKPKRMDSKLLNDIPNQLRGKIGLLTVQLAAYSECPRKAKQLRAKIFEAENALASGKLLRIYEVFLRLE
jgi:hypothetical protein